MAITGQQLGFPLEGEFVTPPPDVIEPGGGFNYEIAVTNIDFTTGYTYDLETWITGGDLGLPENVDTVELLSIGPDETRTVSVTVSGTAMPTLTEGVTYAIDVDANPLTMEAQTIATSDVTVSAFNTDSVNVVACSATPRVDPGGEVTVAIDVENLNTADATMTAVALSSAGVLAQQAVTVPGNRRKAVSLSFTAPQNETSIDVEYELRDIQQA